MKALRSFFLLALLLCLLASCAKPVQQSSPLQGLKPAEQTDMLLSDLIPDEQLHQLQEQVWPQREDRPILSDKAAYDALLAEKGAEIRFLSYDKLSFLGDFVSYASADGDPNTDGFVCPNYAYTFRDSLLNLTWTLYVIEGQPPMPNEDYQPTQDLFYEFLDLYKDSYAEDMRTQTIGEVSNVVEVRHGDVLYFYQNEGGKGICKAILWENNHRAFLAVGDFGHLDTSVDAGATHLITQLLLKSRSQAAAKSFLSE